MSAEKIKGIIFDLDGVLVFTDKYHYLAWKKIADKLAIPFDEKVNDRLRGVSRMESLEIILERCTGPALSQMDKEALAAEKNGYYRELLMEMTPESVTPSTRQTLTDLKNRGYKIAVGSSSKNTKTILQRTALAQYFDAVSDGTNITRSKPDPEVFLKAAEYLGLPPCSCAVVEDARAGIDAALAGGMLSVGIGDAAHYDKTQYPIDSLDKLLDLFKREGTK